MTQVDRLLYWFLTRSPQAKLAMIIVVLGVLFLIGFFVLLVLSTAISGFVASDTSIATFYIYRILPLSLLVAGTDRT